MPTCPVCAQDNPEIARFCLACGAALATTAGPQREERKIVTVLFADLVGFTSRAERLDPEDVRAVLRPYWERLRAELERHGGTVEKFIGDAVMALFGAPVTHEDDPERAVRAALAIRDWIAEQSDELEVRIGVGTGEALVRLGAQPAEGEPMAVGDVVNTAARLQQAAPGGTVVVGEATYRATGDAIVYEQLEPVDVKGKAEPVPLWSAKRARSGIPAERETPTPFVERQDDDVLWRQGRCLSYGEGITFWALGQIVKAHAGILESDSSEDASAKLAAAVDEVADKSDRHWLVTRLAPLIGAARGEHDIQQAEAFAAWRTFLEGIGAQRPLVLVVEDLHWADAALLAFLDDLVEQSVDVPMLVLATARPE